MSLKIRLSRGGAKKRPFYRIVVTDSRNARDGRFIERLGHYNPMVAKDNPDRVRLDEDKIKEWLSKGARPSDRVARFLGEANIIELPKRREQTKKNQPKAKAQERLKAAQEAAEAAAAAPAEEAAPVEAASAEEAPTEETPAEEAPAEESGAEGGEETKTGG